MSFTYGITGLGIMGGSIAKALKKNVVKKDEKIFALDKNPDSLKAALDQKIIDRAFNPEETKEWARMQGWTGRMSTPEKLL